ncbi:MAG: hypothetical protein ACXWOL_14225 [Ktedonobacteraceae bacterium]
MTNTNGTYTLKEAAKRLFSEEAESDDMYVENRSVKMDISFAEGTGERGDGISVILQLSDSPELKIDDDAWMFSCTIPDQEGVTREELMKRIAHVFGIRPDEKIWFDADDELE